MVALKPHTATVYPVTQTPNAQQIAGNPKAGTPVTVKGFLDPMKPSEAFHLFGIQLNNPKRFYIEIADAQNFAPQCLVDFGCDQYVQVAEVETHDAGDILDHAVVYLEGNQYPRNEA